MARLGRSRRARSASPSRQLLRSRLASLAGHQQNRNRLRTEALPTDRAIAHGPKQPVASGQQQSATGLYRAWLALRIPGKAGRNCPGHPYKLFRPHAAGQVDERRRLNSCLAGRLRQSQRAIHYPLFKTVPGAVKKDPRLYEYLALIDAIRLGNAREANLANEILREKVLQA